MADIKAFRAWLYDTELAGQAATLITPPYDVIGAAAQDDYYAANPYNIIRLEWGKTYAGDNEQDNRYTRAARDFAAWQENGVLKLDEQPALYPYVQEFTLNGHLYRRCGFLTTVKAGGYAAGQVLPHEETLPGHKEDRYRLMQACRANFSPIFGLYEQENRAIDQALNQVMTASEPIFAATDEAGVRHSLWRVTDQAVIEQVEQQMAELKIYIADGHHRYETASAFAADMAQAGVSGCDRLLIHLVNLHDPGLIVLPTHRMVKNLKDFSAEALLQSLSDAGFAVFDQPDLATLEKRLADTPEDIASFGLYADGQYHLVSLDRDDQLITAVQPGHSPAYQRLDVSIGHSLILEALCGIGRRQLAAGNQVGYCRQAADAVQAVRQGEYQFALLLNATHVSELLAVAAAGEKMPQKSTYFYPKVIAGLLINELK